GEAPWSIGAGGAPNDEAGGAPSSGAAGAAPEGGAAGAGGDAAAGVGGDVPTGGTPEGGAGGAGTPSDAGAGGADDAEGGAAGACTGSACEPERCGNGKKEGKEECDDGNDVNEDECTSECKLAVCGDRYVWSGVEDCDDGNDKNDDNCPNSCRIQCGDGFQNLGEACDDGNTVSGDGCSADCIVEPHCQPFNGVVCPTGATKWCQLTPTHCGDEYPAEAEIACEVCTGKPCDIQSGDRCDNAGMKSTGLSCNLLFVFGNGLCSLNRIEDCNGNTDGTWCSFD